MRIIEKTIRRGGSALSVVELIPARTAKPLRWMCGIAGVIIAGLVIGMAMLVPRIAESYQLKTMILGGMIGGFFILAALARKVFRSVERASIRSGTRWLGLTHWSPKVPTTKSQILDIGRNHDAALFLTVRRPEDEILLSIGPFIDGDQAVQASALMSPGQKEGEGGPQVDPLQIIQQLEGGAPLAVSRVMMLVIFCTLLIPAWFDRSWLDFGLSVAIGVPLLVLAVVWMTPGGGVFHNTDDSKSVEFWTRHRFFRRLEYRRSLITHEAPEFLQRKLHWPSVGWICLIPIFGGALAGLVLR